MKQENLNRMLQMVTPKVTLRSYYETPYGIQAEVKYEYNFPGRVHGELLPWMKVFSIEADRDGNVYEARGII